MKLAYTFLVIFVVVLAQEIGCLQLKELEVPTVFVIESDDVESIKFDCDYELDSDSTSLVVKWMKDNQAIYQWIRGHEPSAFPDFKDQVEEPSSGDLTDEGEDKSMFLMKPSINATGTYKCIVQTDQDTISKEKHLQIIDLRNYTLTFESNRIQNETHLECKVSNIYPEPILNITSVDGDAAPILSLKSNEDEDGYFDARAIAVVRSDREDDAYECTMYFENLLFNLTTTISSGCLTIQSSVGIRNLLYSIVIMLLYFVR